MGYHLHPHSSPNQKRLYPMMSRLQQMLVQHHLLLHLLVLMLYLDVQHDPYLIPIVLPNNQASLSLLCHRPEHRVSMPIQYHLPQLHQYAPLLLFLSYLMISMMKRMTSLWRHICQQENVLPPPPHLLIQQHPQNLMLSHLHHLHLLLPYLLLLLLSQKGVAVKRVAHQPNDSTTPSTVHHRFFQCVRC